MTRVRLFAFIIVGILLIASFGCGKPQKKQTEGQAEKKVPEKQAVQTQEESTKEKPMNYEITRQWHSGMDVSIPHSATEEQIRRLNSRLKQMCFRDARVIAIMYHCLDHPDVKESIAAYNYNAKERVNKLDILPPSPGNRYSETMTIEEIGKLDAEVEQK